MQPTEVIADRNGWRKLAEEQGEILARVEVFARLMDQYGTRYEMTEDGSYLSVAAGIRDALTAPPRITEKEG